jgi:hypothetical protein
MLKSKFWQAFFALAPFSSLVLIVLGYAAFLFALLSALSQGAQKPDPISFFGGMVVFGVIVLAATLLSLASLVFYIVHAAFNENLKQDHLLLLWILLFIFASGLGQFIYWIVEIVNKPEREAANPH